MKPWPCGRSLYHNPGPPHPQPPPDLSGLSQLFSALTPAQAEGNRGREQVALRTCPRIPDRRWREKACGRASWILGCGLFCAWPFHHPQCEASSHLRLGLGRTREIPSGKCSEVLREKRPEGSKMGLIMYQHAHFLELWFSAEWELHGARCQRTQAWY